MNLLGVLASVDWVFIYVKRRNPSKMYVEEVKRHG